MSRTRVKLTESPHEGSGGRAEGERRKGGDAVREIA